MKRTQQFLLLLCIIASCKKEELQQPTSQCHQHTPNYGKLEVGNYWVYQQFKIDTFGIETPQNIFDSCYVAKDTIINGKSYVEMYRPNSYGPFNSYLRDSAGCILSHTGKLMFSPTDFTNVIRITYPNAGTGDTIAKAIFKMNNKDSIVHTPAGAFITSNFQCIHYMYPHWTNPFLYRYSNTCYAENIGIVAENPLIIYTTAPYIYERRLVRYHVN